MPDTDSQIPTNSRVFNYISYTLVSHRQFTGRRGAGHRAYVGKDRKGPISTSRPFLSVWHQTGRSLRKFETPRQSPPVYGWLFCNDLTGNPSPDDPRETSFLRVFRGTKQGRGDETGTGRGRNRDAASFSAQRSASCRPIGSRHGLSFGAPCDSCSPEPLRPRPLQHARWRRGAGGVRWR